MRATSSSNQAAASNTGAPVSDDQNITASECEITSIATGRKMTAAELAELSRPRVVQDDLAQGWAYISRAPNRHLRRTVVGSRKVEQDRLRERAAARRDG